MSQALSERASPPGPRPVEPEEDEDSGPPPIARARPWPSWEVGVGAVIGVAALVMMANVAAPSLPFDDSYISFAYAAHLVEGNGLRLSIGSAPVEAFSDPLWVALMAAGKAIGFGIVTWARIVNAVLIAVLAGTTAGFVRRLNPTGPRWMAVLAAALVALVPAVPYQAIGGLETLLFAVLLNCVLMAVLADRLAGRPVSVTTTTLCFLAFLTRPEGLVLWVLVWSLSWTWVRALRGQLVGAAWFVVPTIVVEVARLAYFHQWLPNSIVAKSGMSFSTSAHLVWVEVSTFVGEYPPVLVALAVVCIGTIALRRWRTPMTMILAIVLGLALFEVALSAGANYPYERYLLPLLAPAVAVVVAAFSRLGWGGSVARHLQRVRHRGLSLVRLRYLSVALVVATVAATWATAYTNQESGTTTGPMLNVSRGLSRLPALFAPDRLVDHGDNYQFQMANMLVHMGRPGNVVAMDEVGTVAYYTPLRVIDLFGLGDAHIAQRPGVPGTRADPAYVFAQHPRFFVFHLGYCLCGTAPSDGVYSADARMFGYEPIAFVPDVIPDFHPLPPVVLLERNPGVTSVSSLDTGLPAAEKQRQKLPTALAPVLTPNINETRVVRPNADQSAAAVLGLRGRFTALRAGTTAVISVPAARGAHCEAVATAVSSGSSEPQSLTLSIKAAVWGAPTTSTTTVELGTDPTVRTASVALPATGYYLLQLAPGPSFSISTAQWAEPRIECGPSS